MSVDLEQVTYLANSLIPVCKKTRIEMVPPYSARVVCENQYQAHGPQNTLLILL